MNRNISNHFIIQYLNNNSIYIFLLLRKKEKKEKKEIIKIIEYKRIYSVISFSKNIKSNKNVQVELKDRELFTFLNNRFIFLLTNILLLLLFFTIFIYIVYN